LKGYDSHLFINGLYKYGYKSDKGTNLSCLPNNEEKYITFSKKILVDTNEDEEGKIKNVMFEIRFLDTFAFMAESIETLSKNLKSNCKDVNDMRKVFKNTSEHFKDDEQFLLMTEKGIYPYDYITDFNKLNERRLPSRKEFFSKLYSSDCNDEDYDRAIKVWIKFKCKSLLDYHNIYLVSDVLLLTDIWENFRSVCLKNYKLDCEYYLTCSQLSFDAMLKYTEIELELLTDIEKYEFWESGIRGGISQISDLLV